MLFWAPELCSAFSSVTMEGFMCSSFYRFLWQFGSFMALFLWLLQFFFKQYLFIICEREQVFIRKHACHWHGWDPGLTCWVQESDSCTQAWWQAPLLPWAFSPALISYFLWGDLLSVWLNSFVAILFVYFFACLFTYLFILKLLSMV